jgi:hypothetical protein
MNKRYTDILNMHEDDKRYTDILNMHEDDGKSTPEMAIFILLELAGVSCMSAMLHSLLH